MIPADVIEFSKDAGASSIEELELVSGEIAYLLVYDGQMIGLPTYLHYVDGVAMPSTAKESMALFSDPAYMGEDWEQ